MSIIKDLANQWKEANAKCVILKKMLEEASEIEQSIKDKLVESTGDEYEGFGVKVDFIVKPGRIDYKSIPEIKGIDLERYRGPEIAHWSVKASTLKGEEWEMVR